MTQLVLFDLDGTLLPLPSCERRFVAWLRDTRRLGVGPLLRGAAFALRWAPHYGRHVWKKNKAYVAGLPVATVEAWGREFAEEVVRPQLRWGLVQSLALHQIRADTIVLLTGAADFLARPVAESLGVTHVVASECQVAHGRYTADPPPVHPFAAEKLRLANKLCQRFGCSLANVTAYADSIHDRELLAAVGQPVAVCPDPALRRLAFANAWSVLRAEAG
jgi:HAD superfamily hydrolase (TIGR01490 family)